MILVNIFRSALDDKHETIIPEKEISINELFPDVDFTDSVISVNGFLQDETYTLKDGDICAIRLFPEGNPKDWFAGMGLGAVLGMLIGNLIPGLGLIGVGIAVGIGAATGALAAGIASAAGWSLTDWLGRRPGLDTGSPDSLEQIPQLRGAKNQSAYDKPVPIVLGKHLFTPAYIGRPYTTIGGTDGEDQYFHALYLLGYGRLDVTDIKLGEIGYLASNKNANGAALVTDGSLAFDGRPEYAASGPQLELRQGAGEVSLYPQAVVEERLSVELSYPEGSSALAVTRHTAQNPMKVQVEFTLNNGLISYNDQGEKQDATASISIQWKKPQENDSQWKPFGQIGVGQEDINYSAPVTTIIRQKAKIMRFVAERSFTYSEVSDADARTIELRITRANVQANDTRTADRVYLTAIRTWLFDPDASEKSGYNVPQAPMIPKLRDKTARIGFTIKATDALQGNLDALNCIVQSRCRVWNGTQWTAPDWNTAAQAWAGSNEVPTNNPASVALKLLQSPGLGRKAYPDELLDMDSFAEFYEWCDERNYTCNGVLTAEKRLDDALSIVLGTGRAMRILNGNKYGILIDKPREYPVMVLNSQNVLEASNQKSFEEAPDGYSIKFVNEADGYQQTEVYVMADGSNKPGPESVIESIEVPYVTSYEQVVKIGWYLLACKHLRPEVWTRKVAVEGYLVGIGDRVEVQDDTIVVGIGEGAEIKGLKVENGLITEIQTDGLFDVTDTTKLYGIKIMQFDGANPGAVRTIQVPITGPGVYRNFTVAIPLDSAPPLPHEGDLVAFGVYDKITTPAICFGKKGNGDGTFELTLTPYQEGIYTTDSGIIPPYEANITTPQKLAPPGNMPPDPVSKSEILETISEIDFTGAPATVYRLRPSVNVIKREDDGSHAPAEISCSQEFITGDALPETSYKTLTYITSENDAPEYYTGPITIGGGWEWIEFVLSDGNVELDRQRVPVLRNGIPATVYELIPDVSVISRAQDGITLEPSAISCAQRAITGDGSPEESDKTLKYATSAGGPETNYSGPVTVDSDWEWIEFRLYDGDNLLDRERVLILYQYIPATVYELLPSVSVIKHKYDDTIEPGNISCAQVKYTPGLPPSPGDKTVKYTTSDNPAVETVYGGPIAVNPAWAWIEFHLYDGPSLLDLERVPVVYDGSDGIAAVIIDFANDNKIIPCDEDGIPYPGSLPFTNQATLYNAGGGQTAWGLDSPPAGVTIDQAGLITVEAGAGLGEAEEIRVSAVLGGKTYTKTFNVTKIVDGSNPIILDLENDNKTIACNEDGFPLPGALPFTNQAVLYRGNTAVTGAAWRLEGAVPGLSIDGGGLITAEAGTQFADNNDIKVIAAFEGVDYTAVFTASKAYAGKSPVVIHLDNQNQLFMCDIDEYIKPGQLPMTMLAELYRGNQRVTGLVGMIYYPVSGGDDLIDPALDAPYPVEPSVIWSLSGAPPGVTINSKGLITIAENAGLSVSDDITVQALWRGEAYTTILHLGKVLDGQTGPKGDEGEQGDPAPHYRGKTLTPGGVTGLVTIEINANTMQTVQMSRGDWVAYVGDTSGLWAKGTCMRWNGASWEQIPISADGNFETNPYMAALMDLTEGAGSGTFMSILVRDLIAKTAMIEYIASHKLHIQAKDGDSGAVYGGGYDENGNPTGGPGFYLGTDGRLKAVNGEFSGTVNATSGTFRNVTIIDNSYFHGTINAGSLYASEDEIVPSAEKVFSSNTTIKDVWQYFGTPGSGTVNREQTVMVKSGSYAGKNDLIRIVFNYVKVFMPVLKDVFVYRMTLYFARNNPIEISNLANNNNATIGDTLTIGGGIPGKTLRFTNIPYGGGAAAGDVYRDSEGRLYVKI